MIVPNFPVIVKHTQFACVNKHVATNNTLHRENDLKKCYIYNVLAKSSILNVSMPK